jgi:endonuclease/exonuclease/phosphatase family metal-dependent hydrolase
MELILYSYNIHSGKNIFFRKTLPEIIDFFKDNPFDIIAFQEVHNNSKNGWQFSLLKEQLQVHGVFGGNLTIADGHYGNAILSKYPITQSENHLFPSEREQRGVLMAKIAIADGQSLAVCNTHLSLQKKGRAQELASLESTLLTDGTPYSVVMGDFNARNLRLFPHFLDCAKVKGKDGNSTIFPLSKRIDYIFVSTSIEVLEYEVVPVPYSDHYPIRARISVQTG